MEGLALGHVKKTPIKKSWFIAAVGTAAAAVLIAVVVMVWFQSWEAEARQQEETLRAEVAALEEQLEEAEVRLREIQEQLDQEDLALQAMHWFWQLNDAYVRGRTAQCRTLITSMEEAGLQEALPRENVTGTDRFSPYDRYMEIRGRIVK